MEILLKNILKLRTGDSTRSLKAAIIASKSYCKQWSLLTIIIAYNSFYLQWSLLSMIVAYNDCWLQLSLLIIELLQWFHRQAAANDFKQLKETNYETSLDFHKSSQWFNVNVINMTSEQFNNDERSGLWAVYIAHTSFNRLSRITIRIYRIFSVR